MKTIYFLQYQNFQYITTDVTAITEFSIFLGVLGSAQERGQSAVDIPLTRINPSFQDLLVVRFLNRTRYKCPRCKWTGPEHETTPITKDGVTAIDYADGSPIHGCPKCGEHKLTEL